MLRPLQSYGDYIVHHHLLVPLKGPNYELDSCRYCPNWILPTEELTLPYFTYLFSPCGWLLSLCSYPVDHGLGIRSAPSSMLVEKKTFYCSFVLTVR